LRLKEHAVDVFRYLSLVRTVGVIAVPVALERFFVRLAFLCLEVGTVCAYD